MDLVRRLLPIVVVSALALTSCGVEGSYVPGKRAKTQEIREADQGQPDLIDNLRAFAACMRDKGLPFEDPDANADKGTGGYIRRNARPGEPAFEAADDACRIQVFGGADQGPGGERGPEGGDDPN